MITEHRGYKIVNTDVFKIDIHEIDWFLPTWNTDINLGFGTFLRLAEKTLEKYAPLRKTNRKKEKEKIKPWVIRGIN